MLGLLLVLASLGFAAQDPDQAQELTAQAEAALRARDFPVAMARAEAAILADDSCYAAYLVLGEACEGADDFEKAAFTYDNAYYLALQAEDGELTRLCARRDKAVDVALTRLIAAAEQAREQHDLPLAETLARRGAELPGRSFPGAILLGRILLDGKQFLVARERIADALDSATAWEDEESTKALALLLAEASRAAIQELLATARDAWDRRDLDAALSACTTVQEIDDDEPESCFLAGRIQLERKNYRWSVESLRSALYRGKERAEVLPFLREAAAGEIAGFPAILAEVEDEETLEYRRLDLSMREGELYVLLEEHGKAFELYAGLLRRFPGGRHAWWIRDVRAGLHRELGDLPQCVADYRAILEEAEGQEAEPYLPSFLRYATELGGTEGAIQELTGLLERHRDDLTLLWERAKLLQSTGKLEEALGDYDRARALAPQHIGLIQGRFLLLEVLGRPDLDPYSLKVMLVDDPARAVEYADDAYRALSAAGDREGLLSIGDVVIAADPTRAVGHWMRGLGLDPGPDDVEGAIESVEKALELGWDPSEAHAELARLFFVKDRPFLGTPHLLQVAPGTSRLRPAFEALRACVDKGYTIDLDGDFEALTRAFPESAEAWLCLAHAKWKRLSPDEALADFDRAVELDPENSAARLERGQARFEIYTRDRYAIQSSDGGNAKLRVAIAAVIDDLELVDAQHHPVELEAAREARSALDEDWNQGKDLTKARAFLADARRLAEKAGPPEEVIELCNKVETWSTEYGEPDSLRAEAVLLRATQDVRRKRYVEAWEDCDQAAIYERGEREATAVAQRKETARLGFAELGERLRRSPRDVDALVERGNLHLLARFDHDEGVSADAALADARAAVAAAPGNAAAHLLCGQAYFAMNRSILACQFYDRAAALDPENDDARVRQLALHVEMGDLEWLIGHYSDALRLSPTDARSHIARGEVYLTQLDGAKALADFERAGQLDAEYDYDRLRRFSSLLIDPAAATLALEEADAQLARDPQDGDAHLLRAWALFAKGEYRACIAAYRRAPEEHQIVRCMAAMAYAAGLRGDLEFAVELSERMIRKSMEWKVLILLRVKEMTEEKAREMVYPDVCDLYWIRARADAATRLQDFDRALRAFELLYGLVHGTDEEPTAAARLAVARAHAGSFEGALALVPGDTVAQRLARSEVHRLARRLPQALAEAMAASTAEPRSVAACVQTGRIHFQERRFEVADFFFQRALELDERCADAWCGLGRCAFERSSDDADAVTHLSRAIEIDPMHAEARIARFSAYTCREEQPEQAWLDRALGLGVSQAVDAASGPGFVSGAPTPTKVRKSIAEDLVAFGQTTRAVEYCTEWLDLDPDARSSALSSRAVAYCIRGRVDEGGSDKQRVLDDLLEVAVSEPANAAIQFWTGTYLIENDQASSACIFFGRAIALEPTNAQAYLGRARAFLRLGSEPDLQAALADTATALGLDPRSVAAYALRIELYDELGDYDLAMGSWRRAQELDESFLMPALEKSITLRYEREQQLKREEAERRAREEAEAQRAWDIAHNPFYSTSSASDQLDSLMKNWNREDWLSRAIDANRAAVYGINYQDMQGENQMRALEKYIQVNRR